LEENYWDNPSAGVGILILLDPWDFVYYETGKESINPNETSLSLDPDPQDFLGTEPPKPPPVSLKGVFLDPPSGYLEGALYGFRYGVTEVANASSQWLAGDYFYTHNENETDRSGTEITGSYDAAGEKTTEATWRDREYHWDYYDWENRDYSGYEDAGVPSGWTVVQLWDHDTIDQEVHVPRHGQASGTDDHNFRDGQFYAGANPEWTYNIDDPPPVDFLGTEPPKPPPVKVKWGPPPPGQFEAVLDGLKIGRKAVTNAASDTLYGFITIGGLLTDAENPFRIEVTQHDLDYGYAASNGLARGCEEFLFGVLTGGAGAALSRGGKAASVAGKVITGLDLAGNVHTAGSGAVDIYNQGGLTLQNSVQVVGGTLGVVGNVGGWVRTSQKLDDLADARKALDDAAELNRGADADLDFAKPKTGNPDAPETLTHRNGIHEILSEQEISGTTRQAHRAAANRALLRDIESDPRFANQLEEVFGVDDIAAHMRSGRSGLLNPPGAEWHHPIDNPNVVQLLRREVHRHPELQDILHSGPNRTGGFGENF